jgi:hypothetical protein
MARKSTEVGPSELLFLVENEFLFPEGLSEADRWEPAGLEPVGLEPVRRLHRGGPESAHLVSLKLSFSVLIFDVNMRSSPAQPGARRPCREPLSFRQGKRIIPLGNRIRSDQCEANDSLWGTCPACISPVGTTLSTVGRASSQKIHFSEELT